MSTVTKKTEEQKVVCLASGGMDSSVLLSLLKAKGYGVHALSIHYGQRHERELESAATVARILAIPHRVVDLRSLKPLFAGSSLTDESLSVPHGHYAEESMKSTVVPNRNMIMLSVAAAWAMSLKAAHVAYAAHSGDHTIYPDCRPEFADALNTAIGLADWHTVTLLRPFIGMTKGQICAEGQKLGVTFADTWSCYEGGMVHCGRCGTCVERKEAFLAAGVSDPTRYQG
ncbi:MAG: 7-cyano-7-deazaguanine synthase QueC [Proteobacteria bacterium]|nr:7-cyano-7-deazaguanine synthase QueC [Pseudomonadota bacterium]